MSIENNVKNILSEINGRAVLVAASKMNDTDAISKAVAAGISVCGENRVQEMLEKNEQNAYSNCSLHFIGHLQKNKAKYVVGLCDLIQSVDTIDLLNEINRLALKKNITQKILLEINIGEEDSKSGFIVSDIKKVIENIPDNVLVTGLMCIPPKCQNSDEIRPYFDMMSKLFIDIGIKKYDNVSMDFLSMGMSHDYITAIECGSNMVRIGTGIFGPRNYVIKE